MTPNSDVYLVKDGVINNNYVSGLVVPAKSSTYEFYITSTEPTEILEPKFTADENVMNVMIKQNLKNGLQLSQSYSTITLIFGCLENKNETTDFQLILAPKDTNSEAITLTLKKTCDTLEAVGSYFAFLRFVYWVMMIFVIIFAFTTAIYFINRSGMSIQEMTQTSFMNIKMYLGKFRKYSMNKYNQFRGLQSVPDEASNAGFSGSEDKASLNTRQNLEYNSNYGGI